KVLKKDSSQMYLLESNTLSNLVPKMTIYENLLLSVSSNSIFPSLSFFSKRTHKSYFKEVLSQFQLGLESRLHEQVLRLSSGQQQAVAISKVFVAKRDIVLLDEFASALDKKTTPIILSILNDYRKKNNATIIAITHDFYLIKDTADRVLILDNGRILDILDKKTHSFDAHRIMERLYG
ncbi:ATP-binding cassette domain-containing protein, partial [Candidatus Pacearchaeota archaeon]|nr:ATP-binding cassette domain-containing protein [Candidatus Pacearchaeota archaeon]